MHNNWGNCYDHCYIIVTLSPPPPFPFYFLTYVQFSHMDPSIFLRSRSNKENPGKEWFFFTNWRCMVVLSIIVHTNNCGNCYERLESMYVVMFSQESPTGYSLPKAVEARMLHHGQIVVNYLQNWNATKTHQSWHDIEAQNMMFSYWTACMIRKGINLC